MQKFRFEVIKNDIGSRARAGLLTTPHGQIKTPSFVFCATKGTLRGVTMATAKKAGTQVILSNTYHLSVFPGENLISEMKGLHKFIGWSGPMITDSGGFQIFSLGYGSVSEDIKEIKKSSIARTSLSAVKINEEGAIFKSTRDGSKIFLSPEKSMQIQKKLGADIIMSMDECTSCKIGEKKTQESMLMSHRWEKRSLTEFSKLNEDESQALYGIVQGGSYENLRKISCQFVNNEDFFGNAIGGSLGDTKTIMQDIVSLSTSLLKPERPRHLLGIGMVSDLFSGVEAGIDTFDCVHPLRIARHGNALVKPNFESDNPCDKINIFNKRFEKDEQPIDKDCDCDCCIAHSRAYIRSLFRNNESANASSLLAIHNMRFINRVMESIRNAIINGSLSNEKKKWILS